VESLAKDPLLNFGKQNEVTLCICDSDFAQSWRRRWRLSRSRKVMTKGVEQDNGTLNEQGVGHPSLGHLPISLLSHLLLRLPGAEQ
jgi:hypothetical protein